MNELSFGQRIDEANGLIECWFTHGALDWIKQQDWTDKIVWMFGAGWGDIWLSKRCKELHVVERNAEWIYKAQELAVPNGVTNLFYYHRPCNDCSGMDKEYCEIPIKVDVVINDDAYRYEVIEKALTLPRPLTLIIDNYQQDYIFICPAAEEALKEFNIKCYIQPDHIDHDGRPWQTAIVELT